MKMMFKRKAAAFLVLMILLNSFSLGTRVFAVSDELSAKTIYSSASSWAKNEIEKAYSSALIPMGLLSRNAPAPATREELCELAALLYEKTLEKEASAASPNPFTDTNNPAILKAYALGITTGTSPTTFSPNELTTREQVATMFSRAIRVMYPGLDLSTAGAPLFNDQSDISSWALEHVLYMSKAGIIKGTDNYFMPRPLSEAQLAEGYGTTTREQAIAISVRIYEKYHNTGGPVNPKDKLARSMIITAPTVLNENRKLAMIDFSSRAFRPIFSPTIKLTTGKGINGGNSVDSASYWSSAISPSSNQVKTFHMSLPSRLSLQTSAIVWQVSVVPFDGSAVKSGSPNPGGLLLSGKISSKDTQFDVDFSKVFKAENSLRNTSQVSLIPGLSGAGVRSGIKLPSIGGTTSTAQKTYGKTTVPLRTYYVRAYPVDSSGNSVGDAGSGLPVLYGDPLPQSAFSASKWQIPNINTAFSLKPAKRPGTVSYDGEQPNNFIETDAVVMLYNSSIRKYSVLPSGFPADTEELRVQVSLAKYGSSSGDNWLNTSGLVYETSLFSGDAGFKALYDYKSYGIAIDFEKFVPPDSELPESEYIQYFVRVVSLYSGKQTGSVNASYSKTITINYGKSQAKMPPLLQEVKIKPPIPTIEKVSYTPVQWETQGWQYRYVVTRQPTMKDVFGILMSSSEPYTPYSVGTKLDMTPHEENKSWWEEAWDSIKSFFKSMTDFLAKIVNWVSKSYASLKSGLINLAVSALPGSWQGPLRTALTALVDYGLASMGIPPTLPNFDQLANLGTDYLATVAMQQAGIPADSMLGYGLGELSGKIGNNLTESAKAASPNPMNWDFVKLDPECLYRPAYMTVELYNPYDRPTPAGKLSFTANTLLDMSKYGSDQGVTRLYSAYGSSYIYLYKPVFGMEIPSLYPGQRLTVPIILEEYVGVPFPGCEAPVVPSDYSTIYGGLGEYNFNLYIQYNLPPIMEEAAAQKYTGEAIYSYSALGNGRNFTLLPGSNYSS